MIALRNAFRSVRRHPLFAAGLVTSLAVAIAATTATFALVNALLLRPTDGVGAPRELFRVQADTGQRSSASRSTSTVSLPEFVYLRDGLRQLASLVASQRRRIEVEWHGRSVFAPMELVSRDYFQVLGVRAEAGALFGAAQAGDMASPPLIVLSWQFWQSDLGGDPRAVGAVLRLAGVPYTIVGIASRKFHGLERSPSAGWVPAARLTDFGAPSNPLRSRQYSWLTVYGRRPSTVPLEQITTALETVRKSDIEGNLAWSARGLTAPHLFATTMADVRGDGVIAPTAIALWLLELSALLLGVSCLNAGTLMVARGYVRRDELTTKVALGATIRQLLAELAAECAIIVSASALTGVMLAGFASRVLDKLTGGAVAVSDWRVLAYVLAALVATCVLATALPAFALLRPVHEHRTLATRAPSASLQTKPLRIATAAQCSLGFFLLCAAGLLIETVSAASRLGLGVAVDELMMITTSPVTDPRSHQFLEAAKARLQRLPGVRGVALSSVGPLYGSISMPIASPEGDRTGTPLEVGGNSVEPGYFAALGMRVIAGRDFDPSDAGKPTIVIVNEALARLYWPGRSAIGQCVHTPMEQGRCRLQVVGVVSDSKLASVTEAPQPYLFSPLAQWEGLPVILNVRTAGPATERITSVRAALDNGSAPGPIDIRPLSLLVGAQLAPWREAAAMVSLFSALALAFAAIGIYGTTQLFVNARQRELAIRMALGGTSSRVIRRMLLERMQDVSLGVLVGAALLALLSGRMAQAARLLPGHITGVAFIAGLLLVSLAAASCLAASWRIARIQPADVLRTV